MATASGQPSQISFGWREGWRYGLMGLPLAFVALPLYVFVPNHYARVFGVPLATLGVVLLAARLFDAFIDPLLGRWSDRLYATSIPAVLGCSAVGAAVLWTGFALVFFPPVTGTLALIVWVSAALLVTYSAYSLVSILHQSWGAMLGSDEAQRSRIVAWREGLGLLGVVLASISPVAFGLPASTAIFFIALAFGWMAWSFAPRPTLGRPAPSGVQTPASDQDVRIAAARGVVVPREQPPRALSIWLPFSRPAYRALLAVFLANGIASAVPATLILFFVQDRLQATAASEPLFLASYFLSAALAIPLWIQIVQKVGLARTWLAGMLMSIAIFIFAATLGAGDSTAFLAVCALSGIALGTDLTVPAALLAGTIAAAGDRGQAEGAYFGWWNFATKLNLALAAGVSLPLLGWLGYTPGARDADALQTLTWAYCLLPCALKALAAALLYFLIIRKKP